MHTMQKPAPEHAGLQHGEQKTCACRQLALAAVGTTGSGLCCLFLALPQALDLRSGCSLVLEACRQVSWPRACSVSSCSIWMSL